MGVNNSVLKGYRWGHEGVMVCEQARKVKTVKVHHEGVAKPRVDKTVGRTCAMMMWQRVITQGIRAEMPGKRILSSVAIDWVTFRSRALSFWRFVVWSLGVFGPCIALHFSGWTSNGSMYSQANLS